MRNFTMITLALAIGIYVGSIDSFIYAKGDSGDDGKITLRIASASTPQDPHNKGMRTFVEYLNNSGEFKATLYGSSSLFSQNELLNAVKQGNVEMVGDLSAAWFSSDLPELSMFTAGYLFKNYEHMTEILNGHVGKEIFEKVASTLGVRPLNAWYLGARVVNLVEDKPVKTPEDLRGVTLRMPGSHSWLFLGKALGANPVPIPFSEVYLALQQGTVDGQDNPLPTIKNAKFYEVTKSISITNHLIDSVWPSMNEKFWQSLTDRQRSIIHAGIEKAREVTDKSTKDGENELQEFFKRHGVSVYHADIDAFRKHVLEIYLADNDFTKSWDMNLFNKIQSQLQ